MTSRDKVALQETLHMFVSELDCGRECGNCEYGIMRSYGDSFSCPLDLVADMVNTKFNIPSDWKRLKG